MFNPVALLLLLAFSIDAFKVEDHYKDLGIRNIEDPKIHQVLKNIGKRYFPVGQKKKKKPGLEDYIREFALTDYEAWNKLEDSKRDEIRKAAVLMFMRSLIDVSSSVSSGYREGFRVLGDLMMNEFKAEVCGQKAMNNFQYLKYLAHNGQQGYFVERFGLPYEIIPEADKDFLRFKFNFTLYDNIMQHTRMEYNVLLQATLEKGQCFHILEIHQGGTCMNYGEVNHSEDEFKGLDNLVDDIEEIKTNPTFQKFSTLFHPASFADVLGNENPNDLPQYWLSGINETLETKIDVCHEDQESPVKYTEKQFRSWYDHFGIMWHTKPGATDSYGLQVTTLTKEEIIGRVSMNLLMGVKDDSEVHQWQFKFSGAQSDNRWHFKQISILCDSSIQYKDESLKNIRSIIGEMFVNELKHRNDTQWYSTPEFIQVFTKHGHVELTDCASDNTGKTSQLDMFKKHDKPDVHGTKFTKYSIDTDDVPTPAPDEFRFRIKTVSQSADKGETPAEENEKVHEWTFDLKWDSMDQFYYIEKMEIGCSKTFMEKVGETFTAIGDWIGR